MNDFNRFSLIQFNFLFNSILIRFFFNSIKVKNGLRKETNKLLSKGMSNSYLNITIEKNEILENFDFLSLKFVFGPVFGKFTKSRAMRASVLTSRTKLPKTC